MSYGNTSVKHILTELKWAWSRKYAILDIDAGVQEYDLTVKITDYSSVRGVYEVYVGGVKLTPIAYDRRENYAETDTQVYYITPDGKSIGFLKTLAGTEVVGIWYYATHTDVALYTTTLNISLPDEIGNLAAHYVKFLVHDGKRQRNDARNAMIDYTDLLDKIRPQDASTKAKDAPKQIPNVMAYHRFRRTYSN